MVKEPAVRLNPPRILKHLSKIEAGQVEYCLTFEDRRAACADFVGGKGASLALLASMQNEEVLTLSEHGIFCITVRIAY